MISLTKQVKEFDSLVQSGEPILALAPMQDVTDLPFWKVINKRGGADIYFTEYFRVRIGSRLEKPILRAIWKAYWLAKLSIRNTAGNTSWNSYCWRY